MLLTDLLRKNAKAFPERRALTMRAGYRTVSLNYGDIYDLSLRIAALLRRDGVRKGDAVLLLAPSSPYWVAVFWGVLLRGAVLVPLNVQSTPELVRKIAAHTGAKAFFWHAHGTRETPPGLKLYDIDFIREDTENLPLYESAGEARADDLVEIMYTSGTTGEPKGVPLTHKNIASNLEAVAGTIPVASSDVFLSILPLSHIFEQVAGFLVPFKNSAHIVYAHSPAAIPELLREHRITKLAAVPEFLRLFMARIESSAEKRGRQGLFGALLSLAAHLPSIRLRRLLFRPVHRELGGKLRTVASGGAPLDPVLEKKWNALGIELLQGYGLTETSPVVATNTFTARRVGSVGKILPGVRVRLASDGEILVKGPNVFRGYYRDAKKTQEAFTGDGWFRTDDIGEFDTDGFLYIRGRKRYMIKGAAAQNVYPEDIEFELNKIPGVKDSCVVGIEAPGGGVRIHAVLLLEDRTEAFAAVAVEEANKKLVSYQHVTDWSVWPEEDFPRSATRKVKKEEVLAWLKTPRAVSPAPKAEDQTPVRRILGEVCGADAESIRGTTGIVRELHLDSLLRVMLVARIEEELGAAVEEARITPKTTVLELEAMVRGAPSRAPRRPFKRWLLSPAVSLLRQSLLAAVVFPLARLFMRLEVEGAEHVPVRPHPLVFMPNHMSIIDSLALLMALPRNERKIAFAAATDVLYERYASIAWLVEFLFNAFPFPRREYENITSGLEYMGRVLDHGFSAVLYPEGRISRNGELQPLKRGAGLVAVEMDVPVVPVKISGTNTIVPYSALWPRRRGKVTVRFGEPLHFSRRESYIRATGKIHAALSRL